MCPRALLGYPLEPHKMVRTAMGAAVVMPQMVISATLCCGCGICESIACSQGISPRAVINNYKAVLAKNGMRFVATKAAEVTNERGYRMVSSEKWAQTLGVQRFDRVASYGGEIKDFTRLIIPLARHIGAPSEPCVKDMDIVDSGMMVATAAEGLSVPQHTAFGGRVTVGNKKIIIDR
jgi:Na+-translocating ferredoxin:NAD+ oxidoreductase RnfC subunit